MHFYTFFCLSILFLSFCRSPFRLLPPKAAPPPKESRRRRHRKGRKKASSLLHYKDTHTRKSVCVCTCLLHFYFARLHETVFCNHVTRVESASVCGPWWRRRRKAHATPNHLLRLLYSRLCCSFKDARSRDTEREGESLSTCPEAEAAGTRVASKVTSCSHTHFFCGFLERSDFSRKFLLSRQTSPRSTPLARNV